ncbi:DNA methyltransferase [Marinitoga phage MPV1]|uniref:Adenine specific DNA methylase Mod n=1 Tax=Marinitoga piezophila (strain DSM 14283 / JCM 11233 / KA3) TaxID=443254 RepID=H2J419_MARPK|nr:DNA methyltransferase [Marinitoga piezophila]AEX84747.1 adenine specific DNA methylase Mod [Marinitoga piezophila KA3]
MSINWKLENWKNKLFFGDNLEVMKKYIPDEFVDLVYLDPPFNSKRSYNVIFKEMDKNDSPAQIKAFDDTWHWGPDSEETLIAIREHPNSTPKLIDLINGFVKALGRNDATAYLVMLTIRLLEIYRIMKPTASIYLHCDPTMSHYIKVIMDQIFGVKNFKNEIVWCYKSRPNSKKRFNRKHDIILFYTKTNKYYFDYTKVLEPLSEETIKKYKLIDETGRKYRLCGRGIVGSPIKSAKDVDPIWEKEHPELTVRVYLDERKGLTEPDYWYIEQLNQSAKERLGYPTQKPLELLKKILSVSSTEGNIVFDPFCGCGTTIDAAQNLNRKWIGIDITHLAITLIKHRLSDRYGIDIKDTFEVHGEPLTVEAAKELALNDRMEFQIWACGLVGAKPLEKKGADDGIDGIIYFDEIEEVKKALVQVKSGKVSVKDIRDFVGTIEREKAPFGIFITLQKPTRPMLKEAISAGKYKPKYSEDSIPKVRIITIEQLLNGQKLYIPLQRKYSRKAPRRKEPVKKIKLF